MHDRAILGERSAFLFRVCFRRLTPNNITLSQYVSIQVAESTGSGKIVCRTILDVHSSGVVPLGNGLKEDFLRSVIMSSSNKKQLHSSSCKLVLRSSGQEFKNLEVLTTPSRNSRQSTGAATIFVIADQGQTHA